jgi:tetratricopeptide (TPR) repeat protein
MAPSSRRHALAPAAAGAVLLGQITVDWIWLIPGLTAIGIFALSVAGAQAVAGDEDGPQAGRSAPGAVEGVSNGRAARRRRTVGRGGGVALLAAVGAVLALLLSDAFIQRARTDAGDAHAELSAARTASILDPWSVTPHYLESSAYESEGDRTRAHGQLDSALALEPGNSATLGVLGDFEARGGDLGAARAYYRRALALNPLDTGLQQLVRIGESGRRHARRRRR